MTETMIHDNNKMGIYYIPGTFPTGTVLYALKQFDTAKVTTEWTRQKVNDIYYWYMEGIKKGHSPWKMDDGGIASYISEHTNFSTSDTNSFGFVLENLSRTGKIGMEYYTGNVPTTQPQLSKIIESHPFLQYAKTIKWVAIGGIVLVGVYFTWPILTAGRKQLKKRYA